MNADWGFNGTGEFEWFDVKVTSAFSQEGQQSDNDPLIGRRILSNLIKPYAKLTDLDTDCQARSTIYGMQFGLSTADSTVDNPQTAFIGDWTPSIIAQNMWPRVTCYGKDNHGKELFQGSFSFGASSTTIIKDIIWADPLDSPVLMQLKKLSDVVHQKLSVRVTLSYYTRNLPSLVAKKATLGHVTGTIGVYNPEIDTLNVPGQRILQPTSKVPLGMTFGKDDLCSAKINRENATWLYAAPFEIDQANRLHVDFSNSLPVNMNNEVRHIGELKLGYLDEKEGKKCVALLDKVGIQYLDTNFLEKNGGIHTIKLSGSPLSDHALVVVQIVSESDISSTSNHMHTCGIQTTQIHVQILLEEHQFYIRPFGYYVGRLSAGNERTSTSDPIEFYVTHYGNPVKPGYEIKVSNYFDYDQQCPDSLACNASCHDRIGHVIPANGVIPVRDRETINNGRASFTFKINEKIPPEREYFCPPCDEDEKANIPIDGNVYYFQYALCKQGEEDCHEYEKMYAPVFLAFSSPTRSIQDSEIDWFHDVGPILSQYAQTAPTMRNILDLGNYNEVIKPRSRNLLKIALTRNIEDPAYMPTTRDLSPSRRDMIMKWLKQKKPKFDKTGSHAPPEEETEETEKTLSIEQKDSPFYNPKRCQANASLGPGPEDHPAVHAPYYLDILRKENHIKGVTLYKLGSNSGRPLLGLLNSDTPFQCNRFNLEKQLQTAISLEFATIPPYLTALYSIKDPYGRNRQIYNSLRSVVIEEMLHMTQVANILIAMNAKPKFDYVDIVPSYPSPLPGLVLPGLMVRIRKFTKEQLREVFMAIEFPNATDVAGHEETNLFTIASFYDEVSDCIGILNKSLDFSSGPNNKQVLWPGINDDLVVVKDFHSALSGIKMIVEQGEGASMHDPMQAEGSENLAHFFKFEEISCGKKLKKKSGNTYHYQGAKIPFDSTGVWPMKDNPKAIDTPLNSNCYTERKVFHGVFRNLLRQLEKIFNGYNSEEEVQVAVELMESIQIHAKKTMWTKFKPNAVGDDSNETCGPVWDYEWTDSHK